MHPDPDKVAYAKRVADIKIDTHVDKVDRDADAVPDADADADADAVPDVDEDRDIYEDTDRCVF